MVSFVCDACQETLKKAKLDQHKGRCHGATFSCIDCSTSFRGSEYRTHTSCVSEAEKYQKSLYKGPKHNGKAEQQRTPKSTPKAAQADVTAAASPVTPKPASLVDQIKKSNEEKSATAKSEDSKSPVKRKAEEIEGASEGKEKKEKKSKKAKKSKDNADEKKAEKTGEDQKDTDAKKAKTEKKEKKSKKESKEKKEKKSKSEGRAEKSDKEENAEVAELTAETLAESVQSVLAECNSPITFGALQKALVKKFSNADKGTVEQVVWENLKFTLKDNIVQMA